MFPGRTPLVSTAAALLAGAVVLFPAVGHATELAEAPSLAYNLQFAGDPVEAPAPAATEAAPAEATVDQAALECMAKVVHHESRGQPRRGQLAVAQTLLNRLHAGGRFGGSICAVANQHGQFFDTNAYNPRRDTDDWQTALDVSRETLTGEAEPAAPGAIFFHAAYQAPKSFFRGRQRVAAIGGQVFYR